MTIANQETAARRAAIAKLKEEPQALDPTRLLKHPDLVPPEPSGRPRPLFFFPRNKTWMVWSPATTAAAAEKLGKRLQRDLIGKRLLTASDPYLHDAPLLVLYGSTFVEISPPTKKTRAKAAAKTLRYRIQPFGMEVEGKAVGPYLAIRKHQAGRTYKRYNIDHVPTGYLMFQYSKLDTAKAVARKIDERFGDELSFTDPAGAKRLSELDPEILGWARVAEKLPTLEAYRAAVAAEKKALRRKVNTEDTPPYLEADMVVVSPADQRPPAPGFYQLTPEGISNAVAFAVSSMKLYRGRPYLIELVRVIVRGFAYESIRMFDVVVRPDASFEQLQEIESMLQEQARQIERRKKRSKLAVIQGGESTRRKKNADGDAFIAGEPVVYGPLVKAPHYMLAWPKETTPLCNGTHRDTRPKERTGSILLELETGEIVDTDCDNATPVRRIVTDHDQMFAIVKRGATPALCAELCRGYIAPDLSSGVCEKNPSRIRQIKQTLLEY